MGAVYFKGTKAKFLPTTGLEFSDGRTYTYGSGSPEGVVTATIGSFYSDTAAGFLYTKNSGTGNTGWVLSNGLSLDIVLNSIEADTTSGLLIKDSSGTTIGQIAINTGGATGAWTQFGTRTLVGDGVNDAGTIYPNLAFSDDATTGVYLSNLNQLDLVTNGSSRFRILSTGQIQAVYESTVGTDYNTTLHNGYFCRAWVNFNGTGTPAIRASGNVSSITDNGTGDFTINYTTALPDADYSIGGQCSRAGTTNVAGGNAALQLLPRMDATYGNTYTTSSVRVYAQTTNNTAEDPLVMHVQVYR